jgi:hypothetical protein
MNLWTRLAAALLSGFVSFVLALPVACGGLMLYSEHLNGDVQGAGPQAMLGGLAFAVVLGALVAVFVFRKTGESHD